MLWLRWGACTTFLVEVLTRSLIDPAQPSTRSFLKIRETHGLFLDRKKKAGAGEVRVHVDIRSKVLKYWERSSSCTDDSCSTTCSSNCGRSCIPVALLDLGTCAASPSETVNKLTLCNPMPWHMPQRHAAGCYPSVSGLQSPQDQRACGSAKCILAYCAKYHVLSSLAEWRSFRRRILICCSDTLSVQVFYCMSPETCARAHGGFQELKVRSKNILEHVDCQVSTSVPLPCGSTGTSKKRAAPDMRL